MSLVSSVLLQDRIPVHVLFITRKWHGFGGMQRLSRDLWRAMQSMEDVTPHLCRPYLVAWDPTFPIRAFFWSIFASQRCWHLHLGDAALAWLAILPSKKDSPVTLTACGLDVLYPSKLYQSILLHSLQHLGKVACISEATAVAIRQRGVADEKIRVIQCGIWCEQKPLTAKKSAGKTLITVGRLIPRKGVVWFLQNVFPQLRKKFPDVQYHIVGDGPDAAAIGSLQHSLSGVHVHGTCSESTMRELLANADLFVMPNIRQKDDMEGFGIVALEAAEAGVPVVAARLEGITDAVIDGKTGSFFEAGNAADCVRMLVRELESPKDPSAIQKAVCAAFSWQHLLLRYRDEIFR